MKILKTACATKLLYFIWKTNSQHNWIYKNPE